MDLNLYTYAAAVTVSRKLGFKIKHFSQTNFPKKKKVVLERISKKINLLSSDYDRMGC